MTVVDQITLPLVVLIVLALGACAAPEYRCSAVDGVGCASVDVVHRMAMNGKLPDNRAYDQTKERNNGEPVVTHPQADDEKPVWRREGFDTVSVAPGDPLLIAPRELRIWFNRWIDHEGDLHDEQFIYIRINDGYWSIGDEVQ